MRRFVEGFFYIAVGAFALFMLWKIVNQDTTTLVTLSESDVVKQAGDRSLEMAKWTIATVLTVGGLLLGANLLQSVREREEIKAAKKGLETLAEIVGEQVKIANAEITVLKDEAAEARIDLYGSMYMPPIGLKQTDSERIALIEFQFDAIEGDPTEPFSKVSLARFSAEILEYALQENAYDYEMLTKFDRIKDGVNAYRQKIPVTLNPAYLSAQFDKAYLEMCEVSAKGWRLLGERNSHPEVDSPDHTANTPDPVDGEAQSRSEPSPTQSPPDPPEPPPTSERNSDNANTPAPVPSGQGQDEPESYCDRPRW